MVWRKKRFNKYSLALKLMNRNSERGIKRAIKLFDELGDYKDSKYLLDQCVEGLNK